VFHYQGGGPGGGGGDPQGQQQKQQQQREQVEDMKNSILSQVLTQEARARLNTLMLAKPDKGRQVEAAIIQMAQTGQLGGRLSEEELIGLLERFAGASQQTAVKFDRRRNALDSDDD
jgi:programmed cell death protein 5